MSAVQVEAFFRGVPVCSRLLLGRPHEGLRRRRRGGRARAQRFVVGSAKIVDAPIDASVGARASDAHDLIALEGDDVAIHPLRQMLGEVHVGEQSWPLGELASRADGKIVLPPEATAHLRCGDMSFVVAHTHQPETVGAPAWQWRWEHDGYTLGIGVALAVLVGILFTVPDDPRALSLDNLLTHGRLLSFRVLPPEPIPVSAAARGAGALSSRDASAGRAHALPEGKIGDKNAHKTNGRTATKGSAETTLPAAGTTAAANAARGASTAGIVGIVGTLQNRGGALAAIFSRDQRALGDEAETALGSLMSDQIGSAWGINGLGLVGTGAGGGGTGDRTLGVGELDTFGRFGQRHGPGAGGPGGSAAENYGRCVGTACGGAGQLHTRETIVPTVIPTTGTVHGALDKEIVRRIVRRHINEAKYCYEQQLIKKPKLQGRIVVQFTIGGNGTVLSSVLQSSSLASGPVEACIVQAVRRWTFPQPTGGGAVIVSYPFVLAPAGADTVD